MNPVSPLPFRMHALVAPFPYSTLRLSLLKMQKSDRTTRTVLSRRAWLEIDEAPTDLVQPELPWHACWEGEMGLSWFVWGSFYVLAPHLYREEFYAMSLFTGKARPWVVFMEAFALHSIVTPEQITTHSTVATIYLS